MLTYLWEVLECCEGHDVAISVENGDGQVGRLDQLEYPGVGIYSVVNVVLSDLNQVDDLVTIIRVGSAKDNSAIIKFFRFICLLIFKFCIHAVRFFVCFSLLIYLYAFAMGNTENVQVFFRNI